MSEFKLQVDSVLVVYQGDVPHDVLQVLQAFRFTVIPVDIGGDQAMLALDVLADCVIYDHRVVDLTGVGIVYTKRNGQLLPQLMMYDNRPGWEIHYISAFAGRYDMFADATREDVGDIVKRFFASIGVTA